MQTELKYNGCKFTALTWKGSVMKHVLPKVLFFAIWASCIVCLNRWVVSLKTSDFLIGVMVLVLSLLLVFRTNTAYDRYWEGRRLWSTMTVAIRSMARNIWIHTKEIDEHEDRQAKIKVINLLIAYPFSIKRYLREEYGSHYADISCHIGDIPRYSTPSSIQPMVLDLPEQVNHPNSPLQAVDPVEGFTPTNLPLEIAYFLSAYVAEITAKGQIGNPVITALTVNVNSLVDCLSGFERILRTPIPMAYSVHLTHCLWLFCLSLPFQLLNKFSPSQNNDWVVILIVTITVFTAFGIVNIGEEIGIPL